MIQARASLFWASGAAPPFSPGDIPGIQFWADASDAATVLLNTGKVTDWVPKAGPVGNAAQVTADNRPTYTVGAVAGKNAITFNGTAWLTTPSVSINQPITAFFAFYPTDVSSFRMLFDSASPRISMFNLSGTSAWYHAGSNQSGSCTIAANTPHIQTVVFNGASSQIRVDKVQVLTANPGSNAAGGGISFGANGSGAFGYIGYMMEAIIVAGAMSAEDIDIVESYLDRWTA